MALKYSSAQRQMVVSDPRKVTRPQNLRRVPATGLNTRGFNVGTEIGRADKHPARASIFSHSEDVRKLQMLDYSASPAPHEHSHDQNQADHSYSAPFLR